MPSLTTAQKEILAMWPTANDTSVSCQDEDIAKAFNTARSGARSPQETCNVIDRLEILGLVNITQQCHYELTDAGRIVRGLLKQLNKKA